jgi:hypothetical protein
MQILIYDNYLDLRLANKLSASLGRQAQQHERQQSRMLITGVENLTLIRK